MNILIIFEIQNKKERCAFKALVEILEQKYSLTLKSKVEIEGLDYEQFSLVLIYNVIFPISILCNLERINIPKFLICEEIKIYNSFISYSNVYDKVILIKDPLINTKCYLSSNSFEYITYPYRLIENSITSKNRQPQITVALDGSLSNELLIKIAPALNYFGGYDIQVISKQDSYSKITNDNIKILNLKNWLQSIEEADLVIGDQYTALQAILIKKPVIVVGDCGFGGFVIPEIIIRQCNSFFSGRVGGEIGEYIPTKLLVDDIENVMEMEGEEKSIILESNRKYLINEHLELSKKINSLINKTLNEYKLQRDNIFECSLILSSDLSVIKVKEGEYIVYQPELYYIHSVIDDVCFKIIECFKEGDVVSNVYLKQKNNKNKIEYERRIAELIQKDILVHL